MSDSKGRKEKLKSVLDSSGNPIPQKPTFGERTTALSKRAKFALGGLAAVAGALALFLANVESIRSHFRSDGIELVSSAIHSEPGKVIALRKELNDQGLSIPWSPPGVSPQLVETDFDRSRDFAWNRFPILDVAVLNTANSRTVITKITLDAEVEVQRQEPPILHSHIPPSWDYNALVDLESRHQQIHIPILNEVAADETSRFFVTIGNNGVNKVAKVAFDATLVCANGQEIELGKFEFLTDPYHPVPGRCVSVVQPYTDSLNRAAAEAGLPLSE